jgi:hypothetical protein
MKKRIYLILIPLASILTSCSNAQTVPLVWNNPGQIDSITMSTLPENFLGTDSTTPTPITGTLNVSGAADETLCLAAFYSINADGTLSSGLTSSTFTTYLDPNNSNRILRHPASTNINCRGTVITYQINFSVGSKKYQGNTADSFTQ